MEIDYKEKYEKFSIADLGEALKSVKEKLTESKQAQTEMQKEFDALRLAIIPNAMDDMGVSSMKLTGVGRLTVTGDMYAGIVSGMNEGAYQWLEDNGHGDLIKDFVHSSTLKAFLKEQILKGEEIPEEFFKVTPFERASLTKA